MPSDNIFKFTKRFLNELHSEEVQDFHYILESLLEELEEKSDPEMYEVQLVENIYQYLEKLKTMEANLNSYTNGHYKNLVGNKLSNIIKYTDEKYINKID